MRLEDKNEVVNALISSDEQVNYSTRNVTG